MEMERRKLNILCWLLIMLFSAHIPSRLALENTGIERSKSLRTLVQESQGLQDAVLLAKGQRGGRGTGGGTITRTPHKNKAPNEAPHHLAVFNLLWVLVFVSFTL
ncbi:hypothetical protein L2E82_16164 [Cichorium intybus]|uniref:Uncharacterized protein n=1 Tax=Cichorium intybus TaxID=13427 RepID=A0ACB9F4T7_CICIN|nr:hypothetical protein L2E82_16164 [Cichorium intybus]